MNNWTQEKNGLRREVEGAIALLKESHPDQIDFHGSVSAMLADYISRQAVMTKQFEQWTTDKAQIGFFDLRPSQYPSNYAKYQSTRTQCFYEGFCAGLTVAIPDELRRIGALIRTQDNECTADAMFVVERKVIVSGLDTDYFDDDDQIVWCIDDEMIFKGDDEFRELEQDYAADRTVPENYTRTGYTHHWEMVTMFFTADDAQAFLNKNNHKYEGALRVSIECEVRNTQYAFIRNWLASLPALESK